MKNSDLPNAYLEFGESRSGDITLTLTMGYESGYDHTPPRQYSGVLSRDTLNRAITTAITRHKLNPDAETAAKVEQLEAQVKALQEQIELLTAVRKMVDENEVVAW